LCICVNISATVALACMFVPKVYIVLFQPHKNVRQGATKIKGLAAGGRTIFGHPNTGLNSLDVACPSESALSPTLLFLLSRPSISDFCLNVRVFAIANPSVASRL